MQVLVDRKLEDVVLERMEDVLLHLKSKKFPRLELFRDMAELVVRQTGPKLSDVRNLVRDVLVKAREVSSQKASAAVTQKHNLELWQLCAVCDMPSFDPKSTSVKATITSLEKFLETKARPDLKPSLTALCVQIRDNFTRYKYLYRHELSPMFSAARGRGDNTADKALDDMLWTELRYNAFTNYLSTLKRIEAAQLCDAMLKTILSGGTVDPAPAWVPLLSIDESQFQVFADEFIITATSISMARAMSFRLARELPLRDYISVHHRKSYITSLLELETLVKSMSDVIRFGARSPLGATADFTADEGGAPDYTARQLDRKFITSSGLVVSDEVKDVTTLLDFQMLTVLVNKLSALLNQTTPELVEFAQSGWISPYWGQLTKTTFVDTITKRTRALRDLLDISNNAILDVYRNKPVNLALHRQAFAVYAAVREEQRVDVVRQPARVMQQTDANLAPAPENENEFLTVWRRYTEFRIKSREGVIKNIGSSLFPVFDRLTGQIQALRAIFEADFESTYCANAMQVLLDHAKKNQFPVDVHDKFVVSSGIDTKSMSTALRHLKTDIIRAPAVPKVTIRFPTSRRGVKRKTVSDAFVGLLDTATDAKAALEPISAFVKEPDLDSKVGMMDSVIANATKLKTSIHSDLTPTYIKASHVWGAQNYPIAGEAEQWRRAAAAFSGCVQYMGRAHTDSTAAVAAAAAPRTLSDVYHRLCQLLEHLLISSV